MAIFRSTTRPFLLVPIAKLDLTTSAIDTCALDLKITLRHWDIAKIHFWVWDLKTKMHGFENFNAEVQGALNRLFIELQNTHLLIFFGPPQTQRLWRYMLFPHLLVISQLENKEQNGSSGSRFEGYKEGDWSDGLPARAGLYVEAQLTGNNSLGLQHPKVPSSSHRLSQNIQLFYLV